MKYLNSNYKYVYFNIYNLDVSIKNIEINYNKYFEKEFNSFLINGLLDIVKKD